MDEEKKKPTDRQISALAREIADQVEKEVSSKEEALVILRIARVLLSFKER